MYSPFHVFPTVQFFSLFNHAAIRFGRFASGPANMPG